MSAYLWKKSPGGPYLARVGDEKDRCDNCHQKMTPVFFEDDYEGDQYVGALRVEVGGGYGMFEDSVYDDTERYVLLCQDCASRLVSDFPCILAPKE